MAKIVSFSLDNESLELLENIESMTSFRNRSELIRAALQLLRSESKELKTLSGHLDAILVVAHSEKEEHELFKVQHQFSDIITTQVHNNLHGLCMETFVLHGKAETVSAFVKLLKESKSVRYAKFMVVSD